MAIEIIGAARIGGPVIRAEQKGPGFGDDDTGPASCLSWPTERG